VIGSLRMVFKRKHSGPDSLTAYPTLRLYSWQAALVEGSAAQQASAAQRASDSAADGVIRHRTAARTLSEVGGVSI